MYTFWDYFRNAWGRNAGLRIAVGFLFPEYLPRKESLARAGTEAVQVLLGSIPILVVAGVMEAFVSPTGMARGLKMAMAASLFLLLNAYLFARRSGASGVADPR